LIPKVFENWQDFCFIRDVENYQKVFDNPKELMKRALEEIIKSAQAYGKVWSGLPVQETENHQYQYIFYKNFYILFIFYLIYHSLSYFKY
jgi:hypothetical protein